VLRRRVYQGYAVKQSTPGRILYSFGRDLGSSDIHISYGRALAGVLVVLRLFAIGILPALVLRPTGLARLRGPLRHCNCRVEEIWGTGIPKPGRR
jgi:hypothetical protein